ncbi:hemerythrin domain-containing protein [Streptomyces viridosporus]|uniref:hemerythrin domain-containing protein n=1 Tax=Streptomyces viridosporus TaxID=67581 RepID=UPI00332BFFCB
MREYCGRRSLESVAQLTREHDTVVGLSGAVRSAHRDGDVARTARAAREIAAVLAPHTRVEEHGSFPAPAEEFPDHIAVLEAEHRTVEAVPEEAATTVPADPGWPERLLDAPALLREHVLEEQDGVFPAAPASPTADRWEAVEAVRARVGTRLPERTA